MPGALALAVLPMALPLAADDVVSLGPAKSFADARTTVGGSMLTKLVADGDGYVAFYTLDAGAVVAANLDAAGRTLATHTILPNGSNGPLTLGPVARTSSGYLAMWRDQSVTTLAVISPTFDLIAAIPFPQIAFPSALDCAARRCLGVVIAPDDQTMQLYVVSDAGRQMAGPTAFGGSVSNSALTSVAVVARDDNTFALAWSDKNGAHAAMVDGNATVLETTTLSTLGRNVAALWAGAAATFFYTEGQTVKGALWHGAPGSIAQFRTANFSPTAAAWNGSEILLVINQSDSTEIPDPEWDCEFFPSAAHAIRLTAALDRIDAAPFDLNVTPKVTRYTTAAANARGDFLAGGPHYESLCTPWAQSVVTRVTAAGVAESPAFGQPLILASRAVRQVSAAAAADRDLAVWTEAELGNQSILMAARLARDGTRLDAAPIVVTTGVDRSYTASDGRDFFVITRTLGVAPDGYLIDGLTGAVQHRTLPDGIYFGVAWTGRHYVTLEDHCCGGPQQTGQIRLRRFTADGTYLGETAVGDLAVNADDTWSLKMAIVGGRAFIAGTNPYTFLCSPACTGLFAGVVDDDGDVVVPYHRVAGGARGIEIASDATNSVLILGSALYSSTLTATLLSSDTTVLDSTVIATNDLFPFNTLAGRAGDDWLAAWPASMTAWGILPLRSPSRIAGPSSSPSGFLFGFLERPDRTSAALLRDESGRVVERDVTIIPPRRHAAKP